MTIEVTTMKHADRLQLGLELIGSLFQRLGGQCEMTWSEGNYDRDLNLAFRYRDHRRSVRVAWEVRQPSPTDEPMDRQLGPILMLEASDLPRVEVSIRDWVARVNAKFRAEAIARSGLPETYFAPNEEPL